MRLALILAATTMLAACGGGGGDGPQSVGSGAPPTSGGSTGGSAGGGTNPHSFVDPTQEKTYYAIGAGQHYQYVVRYPADGSQEYRAGGELYNSNANGIRDQKIQVVYDPRSAEFTFTYRDDLASIDVTGTYQDPAHRTAFGGAKEPQYGVPDIAGENLLYLENGTATNAGWYLDKIGIVLPPTDVSGNYSFSTFFYQRPGSETNYVTYAGWVRNSASANRETPASDTVANFTLDRAAFVWGERTANDNVPTSGTGTFNGSMLATMVFNDQLDVDPGNATFFQWIHGNATTRVDFGKSTFDLDLTGTVMPPQQDGTTGIASIFDGAQFVAHGSGVINLATTGGFTGRFDDVRFNQSNGTVVIDQAYLSGSSIDGAFFGPNAQEVGGGFRAVGGVPDQRVDIMGAFTGKR